MKRITLLCIAAMSVACTQTPSIDTGPGVELTFDGLVPISNARFTNAWIDPDVDLAGYDKIMAGGAEFEFRAVKKSSGSTSMRRGNETEFWISDKNKQKLIDTVGEVFVEELQKSEHFEIANPRVTRFSEWRDNLSRHRSACGGASGWFCRAIEFSYQLVRSSPHGTSLGYAPD